MHGTILQYCRKYTQDHWQEVRRITGRKYAGALAGSTLLHWQEVYAGSLAGSTKDHWQEVRRCIGSVHATGWNGTASDHYHFISTNSSGRVNCGAASFASRRACSIGIIIRVTAKMLLTCTQRIKCNTKQQKATKRVPFPPNRSTGTLPAICETGCCIRGIAQVEWKGVSE
jgi:hypothetical protein